ncbi:MAG: 2-oxo acid dehydrogenase subunit E2 [Planctomycetota bacterium]|jgi:pyruvate dehydrogenase E2 component (dihydrolipoamide acetyltransferase)|nr:2-oxo acid dehydrogenase subunit E2 [Planctomycetota bacterium]
MIVEVRHSAGEAGPVPDAVMVEWLVAIGDTVRADDDLYRYEVDKAVVARKAGIGGVLRRILAAEGERLRPNDAVALLTESADDPLPDAPGKGSPSPADDGTEFDWSEIDVRGAAPEPLGGARSVIARRMAMSKRFIPAFHLTSVVDMTACGELRLTLKSGGKKATFNDMAIRACALALRKNPRLLGVFLRGAFQPRDAVNIGFAAALPDDGLVVPVVRNADRKSLVEVAAETRALAARARRGELRPEDCSGGVFSVSYLGGYEVDEFTAIVNPGEAAILAVGKVRDAPAVMDGAIVVRPRAKITLSADHRTIDGALAARFTGDVKALLERPVEL